MGMQKQWARVKVLVGAIVASVGQMVHKVDTSNLKTRGYSL